LVYHVLQKHVITCSISVAACFHGAELIIIRREKNVTSFISQFFILLLLKVNTF
jgi:hypothetical protein